MFFFCLCCVVRRRPLVSLFMHRDQGGFAMEYMEMAYRIIFEPMITGQDPWTIAIVLDDYLRWLFDAPPRT